MARRTLILGLCLWLVALPAAAQPETPLQLYGELFVDVQLQRVFEDGKTFADAVPNDTPATILAEGARTAWCADAPANDDQPPEQPADRGKAAIAR